MKAAWENLSNPGFWATYQYKDMKHFHYLIRKRHSLFIGGKILLCRILSRWIKWYYHCDIPYTVDINGVFFCHSGLGVVVNPNAIIGKGTMIQHSVTIGSKVWIAANTTITKGVIIGDNTVVASNSLVNKQFIGRGNILAGCPAKIVKQIDHFNIW